jgi:ribosome maturation factor RimP
MLKSDLMTQDIDDSLHEPRLIFEEGAAKAIALFCAPILETLGFRLVRVRLSGQNGQTLQIMAEKPDGTLGVNECETISTMLSPALDAEDIVKGAYYLEVSSPGIDRPLVRVSDFTRAVSHEVKIELHTPFDNRKRFRGFILGVEGENLKLHRSDAAPNEIAEVALNLNHIDDARLILSEVLIREALRKAKAEEAAMNETIDPPKGPGRYAAKNAAKASKKTLN